MDDTVQKLDSAIARNAGWLDRQFQRGTPRKRLYTSARYARLMTDIIARRQMGERTKIND